MTITFAARVAAVTTLLVTLPAASAVAGGGGGGGGDHHPSDPVVLAENLVGPLHVAAGSRGVAVAESFGGRITLVSHGGTSTLYSSSPGSDLAGMDWRGSTLFFLSSQGAGMGDPTLLAGSLMSIDRHGTVGAVTDGLAALETGTNPDATSAYGLAPDVAAANPACVDQLTALGIPASYGGQVDSHPYGLALNGRHAYIADAGSNTVIDVNLRTGEASTLAVLPPQPVTLTAEQAAGLGVPDCAGLTYSFEPVPTDIAVGRHGMLYVSTLPGGPEGPELGARGAVYTVDRHGTVSPYVQGILSPTGIDLDARGNLYVASLFGEGVLRFDRRAGSPQVALPAVQAADVDVRGGRLYATTGALGSGALVKAGR